MPFITQEHRNAIERGTLTQWQPGDLCYLHYKEMVRKWKENPRWATVHEIFKGMSRDAFVNQDNIMASQLAWQIFFIWWVVPYEREMEERNGAIK